MTVPRVYVRRGTTVWIGTSHSLTYTGRTNIDFFCAKRHFRSCVTEIDPVCLFACLFVRSPESAFRPHKYRLAEATVGFGGPAKK